MPSVKVYPERRVQNLEDGSYAGIDDENRAAPSRLHQIGDVYTVEIADRIDNALVAAVHSAFYQRLVNKARKSGAPDPDAAADEAIGRAFKSQEAVEAITFYYSQSGIAQTPAWSLQRLTGWLYMAVLFVSREQRRQERPHVVNRSHAPDKDKAEVAVADDSRNPENQLLTKEFLSALDQCLGRLRENQRVALLMKQDAASLKDIADTLKCSDGNAGALISRGRERLRKCMQRKGWL